MADDNNRVYLFDSTLRDGAQTQGVDFSVGDKMAIALALDSIGIDYVEAVSYTHLTLPTIYSV